MVTTEIKRCLILERKAMTNLDSVLKSRDITLLIKLHIVKTMVFLIVMYECESRTIKKAEVKVAQSCPTLWDPMDCGLPGFSVHGIFQARVLEWVAISFSRGSSLTQGSNPGLPHLQVDALPSKPPGKSEYIM